MIQRHTHTWKGLGIASGNSGCAHEHAIGVFHLISHRDTVREVRVRQRQLPARRPHSSAAAMPATMHGELIKPVAFAPALPRGDAQAAVCFLAEEALLRPVPD